MSSNAHAHQRFLASNLISDGKNMTIKKMEKIVQLSKERVCIGHLILYKKEGGGNGYTCT